MQSVLPPTPPQPAAPEADPLRFRLDSWQHWMLVGALPILAAATALAAWDQLQHRRVTAGEGIPVAVGTAFCIMLTPMTVLTVAVFVKKPGARRILLSVGAPLFAAFSLLYFGGAALAFVVQTVQATQARTRVALNEARAVGDSAFKESNDLLAAFEAEGGLKAATLTTRASLSDRLALMARMRAANAEALRRLETLRADIDAVFDRNRLSTAQRREFWAGYNRSGGLGAARTIRQYDRQLLAAMEKYLTILSDEFEVWTIDYDDNLVFDDDDVLEEFNRVGTEVRRLSAEQRKLMDSPKSAPSLSPAD